MTTEFFMIGLLGNLSYPWYCHAIRGRLLIFGMLGRPRSESRRIHRVLKELRFGAEKICAGREDFLGADAKMPCNSVNAFANGVRFSIANSKQDQINNTPRRADFPLRLCAFARALFFGRSRQLTDPRSGLLINFGSELIKDGIFRAVNGLQE